MKREAQLEFFIPRYGLGLVPRLSRLISCGCDAPPSGVAKWRPRGKAKRELSAWLPHKENGPSLGVSLIQFAERTILAYLVLLGVGSRANRSQNRNRVSHRPLFPISILSFGSSGARASVGAFLGRQTKSAGAASPLADKVSICWGRRRRNV